jgi:hypothetical protein
MINFSDPKKAFKEDTNYHYNSLEWLHISTDSYQNIGLLDNFYYSRMYEMLNLGQMLDFR